MVGLSPNIALDLLSDRLGIKTHPLLWTASLRSARCLQETRRGTILRMRLATGGFRLLARESEKHHTQAEAHRQTGAQAQRCRRHRDTETQRHRDTKSHRWFTA
eukprot:11422849-Alexandrium_andersonii.AAC.1